MLSGPKLWTVSTEGQPVGSVAKVENVPDCRHVFGNGIHPMRQGREKAELIEHLIVNVRSPIDVISQTNPTQSPAKYDCLLSGLQASTALMRHDGIRRVWHWS